MMLSLFRRAARDLGLGPAIHTSPEAKLILEREHRRICKRTDRLIAGLMLLQWPGAVIAALLVSARTWDGGVASVHPHVITALFLGGLITVPPVLMAFFRPAAVYTRHVIAACQMLMSGLLIHVSGGQIETHFHVFGSLAFLCFYLDWPVLLTATVTTLANHLVMGYLDPIAIFGTSTGTGSRMLQHVLWVVFCDCFMMTSCVQSLRGLRVTSIREAEQEELLHQAYHDNLTGLANRLLLQKKLGVLLDGSANPPHPFALISIDLDRFKEVNDNLGHQAGDTLLCEISNRLQGLIRKQDVLARMGGDEFVLLLTDCESVALAERIAERILECLTAPVELKGQHVRIGASMGICLHPNGGLAAQDIFHHADLALYRAKKAGRNAFLVFDEAMRAETLLEMSLEHRLRAAVHEEALHVHYQPIVDTGGCVMGFEALLRWNDDVHGQVSPAQFIPIAERTGLIIPLGNWVLAQACGQAAEWNRTRSVPLKISVNVSSAQLAKENFVTTVLATLKQTGLSAELLDLELTESVLIENHGQTQQTLALLRRFGVQLSIDDFGTGYSSLSYLRELPVDTLKIDRAFVRDIEHSSHARSLIQGMIEMGHSLQLRVLAEGVETRRQMEILSDAGCDQIQGFHISKAVSPEAAERLMGREQMAAEKATEDLMDFAPSFAT